MFKSTPAIGCCWRSLAARVRWSMSSPIIWAKTGRPVLFSVTASRMCFSSRDWEWTRKYSVTK